MTVQTNTNVASFNGNGVTQIFPIAFKFNNDTDLVVLLVDDATGSATPLTLNSGYTVSGEGDEEGGLINVVVAPAVGQRLFVSRVVDILQMTDLRNQGKFFAEVHEDAFDLLTMIAQQHQSGIARSLRVAETDPEPARIPSVTQRAGRLLSFDSDGNPTTALPVVDSSTGLRQELASTDGASLIGTTPGSLNVQQVLDQLSDISGDVLRLARDPDEIVSKIAAGGRVVIENGLHYMASPAVIDYTGDVGYPGHASKRYDISGQTPGGTILSNQHSGYAITCTGSYPVTQNVHGNDRIGNLTITGPVVTLPNTDNSGGSGLKIANKSFTTVYNYSAVNLKVGLALEDVLSSSIRDVSVTGCYQGIQVSAPNELSGPNAMNWSRVNVANAKTYGVVADVGAAAHFDNLTIEGCGTAETNDVGLYLSATPGQIGGVVNITSFYSELNAGLADIYINNDSAFNLTVNIMGSLFARVSAERFTTYNIRVSSSGGGKVVVNLIGCSFLSHFGYVPHPSRPFWLADPNCEVNYDAACVFRETTSLPAQNNWTTVKAIQFGPDGVLSGGAIGMTAVREGAGVYLVTSETPLAASEFGYQVTSSISGFGTHPASLATSARSKNVSASQFRVETYNPAGVTVDSYFTCMIARIQ